MMAQSDFFVYVTNQTNFRSAKQLCMYLKDFLNEVEKVAKKLHIYLWKKVFVSL